MKKRTSSILLGVLGVILIAIINPVYGQTNEKPMELKVSSFNPAQLPVSQLAVKWGKMVEERSGGKVKLTFYFGGTLAAYRDTFRVTQSGVADIGLWLTSLIMGAQPLHEFLNLPFPGWDNIFNITKIYHEMREKFPELDAEFMGMKCLYATAMPPSQLHMTKKSVRLPEDIRGIKIIGGANLNDIIALAGGVPVDKPPQDWYMSLQKGLVDGMFTHWPASDGFKLTELFASHTEMGDAGISTSVMGYWMNEKSWNRLPPEAKKAFIDLKDWLEQEDLKLNNGLIDIGRENARKMGHEIIRSTPKEIKAWTDITKPIRDKWIADTEKKGLPARELYDEVQRRIALYCNK